jgi:hypothetical protein
MALRSQNTAVGIAVQSVAGTFVAPTTNDLYPATSVRLNIEGITTENPEMTGTIHKPGAIVIGKRVSLTLGIVMRPPGGSSPPSADGFIPGRLLRAAGFTENVVSAAIPSGAAETIGAGSTTSQAVLGSTAAATANLYKGLALHLSDNGASYNRQLTAIRAYTASKEAKLFEVLGAVPADKYQIPKQLAYQLSGTTTPPSLSMKVWYDGFRYDLVDMAIASLRFTFPTSTRESTEYPVMEFTLEGDIYATADESTPVIPALGGIPTFRDGDFWLADKALGGSSFTCDMGITVGYPPNPNRASGNDPAQMVETRRSINVTLNHQLKAALDLLALADAQTQHGLWAQYGYTAGNMVVFNVPDARFGYANPDNGGQFVTQTADLFIDQADRAINLIFPY